VQQLQDALIAKTDCFVCLPLGIALALYDSCASLHGMMLEEGLSIAWQQHGAWQCVCSAASSSSSRQ
jgi:hypothetical protein